MAPEVKIHPIKQLYGILEKEEHSRAVAILCSSHGVQGAQVPVPHITEIFDDVDMEIPSRSLSAGAASRIVGLIRNIGQETEVVYVCCDSGVSRSSAIAAAVCRYFSISGNCIWENPQYQPNPLAFRLLCEKLDIPVNDELLDFLIATN